MNHPPALSSLIYWKQLCFVLSDSQQVSEHFSFNPKIIKHTRYELWQHFENQQQSFCLNDSKNYFNPKSDECSAVTLVSFQMYPRIQTMTKHKHTDVQEILNKPCLFIGITMFVLPNFNVLFESFLTKKLTKLSCKEIIYIKKFGVNFK